MFVEFGPPILEGPLIATYSPNVCVGCNLCYKVCMCIFFAIESLVPFKPGCYVYWSGSRDCLIFGIMVTMFFSRLPSLLFEATYWLKEIACASICNIFSSTLVICF